MLKKTEGREYFYSVSGLMPPKYMVSESLEADIESFVDWVEKNSEKLEDLTYGDLSHFISEMEKLYIRLCSIYAHWLEMEASRILRLAEINEEKLCRQLIGTFSVNLRTLAIDIQMAQSNGFETNYRQRNELERYRSVISSLKVLSQMIDSGEYIKALDFIISIDELKESGYALPLIDGVTAKDADYVSMLILETVEAYKTKIDGIISSATDTIELKKLLIVDDMPEMLTALSYMLKEHYHIFAFTSGKQALDFIEHGEQIPDAFILDIVMPDMDGFTLADNIRSREGHKNTPIIFLTGNSSRDIFLKALMYDAKAFIVKPANKDIIISKLSMCLN